jgi:hypothetical protein
MQVIQFLPLLHCSAILLWFKKFSAVMLCYMLFGYSSLLFSNSSLVQKLFYSFSLLHAILLFYSCFYLFDDCYSSLSFISSSAFFHFTLLTIHLIVLVRTTNLPQSLRFHFILYHLFSYTLNLQENTSMTELPTVQES